jgi:hypothetical protein
LFAIGSSYAWLDERCLDAQSGSAEAAVVVLDVWEYGGRGKVEPG